MKMEKGTWKKSKYQKISFHSLAPRMCRRVTQAFQMLSPSQGFSIPLKYRKNNPFPIFQEKTDWCLMPNYLTFQHKLHDIKSHVELKTYSHTPQRLSNN